MSKTGNFIRGLRWHIGDLDSATSKITNFLNDKKTNHIITANMEILSMAFKSKELKELCANADMHIPDGIGAVKLLKKLGFSRTKRIPGIELCLEALKKMPEGTKIYLFGAREGIARKALENLSLQFLHLVFVGSHEGFGYEDSKLVKEINNSGAQVLLAALGVPKQELWIAKNKGKLNDVRVAIGVGGSFDVWAGDVNRAPRFFQKTNLEWAWRIFSQPARLPKFLMTIAGFLPVYLRAK